MRADILFINPPIVITDQGSYAINEIQGHVRIGGVLDIDTMQMVTDKPPEEECSV